MWMFVIAAAAAAAQAYQSEQARGASAAQLKKMQQDFEKLVPPNFDMKVTDPPQMIEKAVPPPDYNTRPLTPEQFKIVGQYKPEAAAYIAEKNPELVKQSAAADEGRQAQIDALRKMRGIASSDFDPELAAKLSQASRQAQTDAQSRQQSILTDMARRGAGNSGIAAALQAQAGSQAMDREAQLGQNAAAEAYQNRLAAIRQSAQMGGDINRSENDLSSRNAQIMNDYNQRMTKSAQDWQNQRASMQNDAQMQNLRMGQDTANRNTEANNKYALMNRDRADQMAREKYQNAIHDRDYQNFVAQQRADWQQRQKEYLNNLRGQQFNSNLSILQGAHGIASQGIANTNQRAADRNQMIQGIGNAVMGTYQSGQDEDRWNRQQDREDERTRMKYGYDEDEE